MDTIKDKAFTSLIEKYSLISNQVSLLRENKVIYPEQEEVLNAFKYIDNLENTKVVIIGQDPYHGEGQAHGFAFSVKPEVQFPPSLINIFKELEKDLDIPFPNTGCLESWAKQGVLLLNRILTVENKKPLSHKGLGWEVFTEGVIRYIDRFGDRVVFILWGREAQKVEQLIKNNNHFILKAAHPSPLSATRGFFGCKHFSKCNEFLSSIGKEPIDWKL